MNPVPNGPRKPAARARASKKPAVREVKATRMPSAGQIQPLDLGLSNRIGGYSRKVALPRVGLGRVYAPSRPFAPHHLSRNQAIYTSPNRIACARGHPALVCNRPLQKACPYCGSSAKWHARLWVYRIESGKATDALRRDLIKSLPQDDNRFAIVEEKATQQEVFFEWLEKIGKGLDLDGPDWLREVAIHFLSRKEPKTDWRTAFERTRSIRRSRRLESGWELDNDRLFLAPHLFDELLLVQYLISRSHRAGGLTLEGRYTLPELITRLRNSGYLRAVNVPSQSPGETLEQARELFRRRGKPGEVSSHPRSSRPAI